MTCPNCGAPMPQALFEGVCSTWCAVRVQKARAVRRLVELLTGEEGLLIEARLTGRDVAPASWVAERLAVVPPPPPRACVTCGARLTDQQDGTARRCAPCRGALKQASARDARGHYKARRAGGKSA